MFSVLKRRASRDSRKARAGVARDPSARFAYDLATKPPTKDVASVKAASDVFEANVPVDPSEGERNAVRLPVAGRPGRPSES